MTTSSTADVADVLGCGHNATPATPGTGTGIAIDTHTGATSCYPCSNEQEREAMTRANIFLAYVSTDGDALTTWPGGHLATIDLADTRQPGRRTYTPSGGMWTRYLWHATDTYGGRWAGVNGGPGLLIRLRRLRACTRLTESGNGRGPRYCHRRATHAGQGGAADLYCPSHARQVFDLYGWTTTALPLRTSAPITA
ncbi:MULTISPECIES: hypothetical protein [unclassified Crossiella]|uniref:hypothetical protein n=1 Tax=unclassified Crossiella TaxID=2620835 RepID=UPI001FFF5E07|nr:MULTISPECIES: hypothetical protein [unclassified Crossiella]MCK2240062.1 hypothetical protein [Crossiella sp. S99.2]MCK2252770.1 hypothetical protein [Crossiella sp. S99.1]